MSRRNIALLLSSAMLACALSSFSGATMVMAEEAGTASSGDAELTVGLPQDLDNSLDPYQITAAGTREVLFNVYEGLVKPDTDGNFVDAVASEHEISEDGLTYTFTLRDGVIFQYGAKVPGHDVV